jgi:hypothetical protein
VTLLRKLDAIRHPLRVEDPLRRVSDRLQEGLVEAAVAKAFDRPLAVRRANMLTGDVMQRRCSPEGMRSKALE